MKNLILQHFEPFRDHFLAEIERSGKKLPWLVEKSVENISRYAEKLGAEYKLLDGEPFQKGLRGQCQKCCIINEEYDEYDTVVILDTDKFVTTTCTENVFEAKGIAPFDKIHRERQLPSFQAKFPILCNMDYPMWSGAIYVMPREFRQLMRKQINPAMREVFKQISPEMFVDEGMFHVMCVKAKWRLDTHPNGYLDERWDQSSYLPNPEKAFMIHVRHKPKNREDNLRDLMAAGIIEA